MFLCLSHYPSIYIYIYIHNAAIYVHAAIYLNYIGSISNSCSYISLSYLVILVLSVIHVLHNSQIPAFICTPLVLLLLQHNIYLCIRINVVCCIYV